MVRINAQVMATGSIYQVQARPDLKFGEVYDSNFRTIWTWDWAKNSGA